MIRECIHNHSTCGKCDDPALPGRVLYINEGRVRLYETTGERSRYAALSHCWGDQVKLQTTSENYKEFISEIPWDQIPKTFQDAITFARGLDLGYIWIDSVCIIQDSENDWQTQSAKMKEVYEGAYVTLAATHGAASNAGCFATAEWQPHKIAQVLVGSQLIDLFARRKWRHLDMTPMNLKAPPDLLLGRGWVFQERFLSQRVVHFTRNELIWECNTITACECGVLGDGRANSPKKSFRLDSWTTVVNKYTELRLTKAKDRLPALSGIAKTFALKGGNYHAGLWETDLPHNLCWYARQPSSKRPKDSGYPSWSWASTANSVTMPSLDEFPKESRVRIQSIQCDLAGVDPHGQVVKGQLIISGEIIPASTCDVSRLGHYRREQVVWLRFHSAAVELDGKAYFCFWDEPVRSPGRSHSTSVYCMQVVTGWYLVLKCLDKALQTYKRIGLLRTDTERGWVSEEEGGGSAKLPTSTITIIWCSLFLTYISYCLCISASIKVGKRKESVKAALLR
ncbi:uncharacterized protein A1O5_08498 [Cladophialophora psammophila CBS 110553]|uniref:Heterokaryon incompatibility domain-containing protein n=1 Tax=Cladophialophora psammophila CBS 110553 TaxID=1182543 RepID=W9XE49_9EURO|nr:uncharacterized protein A1O5_08498 [Cladophialophora psammophila CBS 110553]EXJ68704.1 hypothetical protein A1O5_08498 [Cladophialophora psammophila CBS 110553]